MNRTGTKKFVAGAATLIVGLALHAVDTNSILPYVDLSLEELINIKVTSVSKRETRLEDSPAAIAVLTGDEIGRLGFTSVAESLRAVPGMEVARLNANTWAITARGFNKVREQVC
jgi:outer membrane receptor protein involved in Fe transport